MPYIEVEYDLTYTGGDHSDVGTIVRIPSEKIGTFEGDDEGWALAVEKAFQEQTGVDPIHITHIGNEEFEDEEFTAEDFLTPVSPPGA